MKLKEYIKSINKNGDKALAVYLTAGFPEKENFVKLALDILDAGADILEIGIPFSDPLADGPVIQYSSSQAIKQGINTAEVLKICEQIRKHTDKPLVIMSYANPILHFGIKKFYDELKKIPIEGLILPDVPMEEIKPFGSKHFDNILLAAPNSKVEKLLAIDKKSQGFVYGVSVTGVTGERENLEKIAFENVTRLRKFIKHNKLMIGFGIKKRRTIENLWEHCDGFIVGSAIIQKLIDDTSGNEAIKLVKELKGN